LQDLINNSNSASLFGFNFTKSLSTNWSDSNLEYQSQLDYSSYEYKMFKTYDTYRLGIQLQDKYGIWSNVIYLKDLTNNTRLQTPIRPLNDTYLLTTAPIEWKVPNLRLDVTDSNSLEAQWLKAAKKAGFKGIRPVIVYP
jgi:hypothetical protein